MSSRTVQRASARQLQLLFQSSTRRLNGVATFSSHLPRQLHHQHRIVVVMQHARYFSDKSAKEEKVETQEEEVAAEEENLEPESEAAEEQVMTREQELEEQVKELKNQLLRGLAEQENTRRIAKKDVQSAKNFAVSSFAKSLLETSDNLSRALESVTEEDLKSNAVLSNLYEGIQMTEAGLVKAFEKNGLVRYGDVGDVFDPNKHEALFEYPDPEKEAGSVGQVMKKGFLLNDRVVRPAEVGVVKK